MPTVNLSPEVSDFLSTNPVCAVGISGGKDSHACLLAVHEYLDSIRYEGVRLAVHADLGRTEWAESLPKCRELCESLGWELAVVQRNAGDLMHRWEGRWNNNVARYKDLLCVQLILPWSTPSLRFCSGELKAQVIRSYLKKRFPGQNILNITGVRRQESASRAKMPLCKEDPLLGSKKSQGMTWNAIIDWDINEVFAKCRSHEVALHPAYTEYGLTRVSCSFCILASLHDLTASSQCPTNHDAYRLQVDLEIESAFSFQSNRWLADVAPHLLTEVQIDGLARAKLIAQERKQLEDRIPKELRYVKGWPVRVPTQNEAQLLADTRSAISNMYGFESNYLTASSIIERYSDLMSRQSDKVAAELLIPTTQLSCGTARPLFTF